MRNICLSLTLFLLIFPVSDKVHSAARNGDVQGVIIVANKSSNDVYFIERTSGDILKILPTGLEPHEVEVSDDGRLAVVCNYGNSENPGNTLSVYDVENLKL
jgi:DNA-binding beta-propeller fold protein YncE